MLKYNTDMKIDISHIASLANLHIKDNEKEKFTKQLSSILEYVAKLDELNTSSVEPTSQVTGLENVLRGDTTRPSFSQDEATAPTKNKHSGYFAVKGIFDNE